jgi:hypothetical protein
MKPAYSVSFLLSINIFVWQNVLYLPNDLRIYVHSYIIIIIINQQFAVNHVTITTVSHKNNTFNIPIIVETCKIKSLVVTFGFL